MRFYHLVTILFIFSLAGCTTAPLVTPPKFPPGIPGIYHRVKKGQTLWRISKMYNIDLDEIIKINHISDATSIEVGQLIFIPHCQRPQTVSYAQSYSDDFIWPVKGKVISSFGQNSNNMVNKGIDIQASQGSTVVAAQRGKVVFYSPNFQGYGKTIIIEHPNGFSTVYARDLEVLVRVGDNVEKGIPIAKIGSAGRDKNNYLHFQIRKGHIAQNPNFYLPR